MATIHCGTKAWTVDEVMKACRPDTTLKLTAEAKRAVRRAAAFVTEKLADGKAYYGINTGFGALYKVQVEADQLSQLQENLVKSHACGTGDRVPDDIVRLMLLLKVRSLSYGYSGIRPVIVERLMDFFNLDLLPVVYQQGSLGASGDLAPLAHLSLPLLGLGEVVFRGQQMPAARALKKAGLEPLSLSAKEGLALLNGTQFSLAYGTWALYHGKKWWQLATETAALSLDAFNGNLSPFDAKLHRIRPHKGQVKTARLVRQILKGSTIAKRKDKAIQDPYSFRCVPQVHGASWDALMHAESVLTTEINSVTDNPNVFVTQNQILSGGNFHAQPLALVLDYMGIALAELANISERRTYLLLSGRRDLPAFLTPHPGLQSGLMIPQYTAASIVSQNKQLATPASVDSIVSSNGQEDHVSMAANAATKLYRIVENTGTVIAIEWMAAAQALYFRKQKTSPVLEKRLRAYRKRVSPILQDRILSKDIRATRAFLEAL